MPILGLNVWVLATATSVLAMVKMLIVILPGVHHARASLLTFLDSAAPNALQVSREI